MSIEQLYIDNKISGWGGEKLALKAWNMLKTSDSFKSLPKSYKSSTEKRKVFLHLLVRKLLNRDVENFAQKIGDCVSWGARNAIEYLECSEILLGGDLEKYRPIFAPYLYGTGRVFVGKGQLGRSDGSLGSWQAEAVIKYGALASDEYGCPPYSGEIASAWGYKPGPPEKYVNIARLNPVKSASIIKSWDDLVTAISNGYPCTVASDQGFSMTPDSEGFHRPQGRWMHQMCAEPHSIILSESMSKAKDVKVGDYVYTDKGILRPVTQVFERNVKEKLQVIKCRGALPLKVTKNHPVLVYRTQRDDLDVCQEFVGLKTGTSTKTKKMVKMYVNAEDVKLGDYLVCPKIDIKSEEKTPDKLIVSDDVAWMIGLYAADGGSTKNHKIVFTLGVYQKSQIERLIKTISSLGFVPHCRYYEKFVRVTLYNSKLSNLFIQLFGKKHQKRIPNFVFNGEWNLREVLQGIYDGDGNLVKMRTKRIVNTSLPLIYQIYAILLKYGEKPYISQRKHCSEYAKNWNDIYVIEWTERSKKSSFNHYLDNELLFKVHSIEEEEYDGLVYNYEVDIDHTYIANGLVVHNCITGIDESYKYEYGLIRNSWGNVHGQLYDFNTNEKLPVGYLRVKRATIERMIQQGDTFAYSNFSGFPVQYPTIEKALFKMI